MVTGTSTGYGQPSGWCTLSEAGWPQFEPQWEHFQKKNGICDPNVTYCRTDVCPKFHFLSSIVQDPQLIG